jgi:hypothetical protein
MSEDIATTMNFHIDAGMMIAMTTGYYSGVDAGGGRALDARGLRMELPSGQRVQVQTRDEASLLVLMGAAGASWLEPVLGAPLRPVPHGLFAAVRPGETRSWFGKMFLPPGNALVPVDAVVGRKGGQAGMQPYAVYRQRELQQQHQQSSASKEEWTSLLPTGCGGYTSQFPSSPSHSYSVAPSRLSMHSNYSAVAENALCALSDGTTGVLCWMQCRSVADLPCGTSAQCVDPVTGQVVDGADHCPESDKSLCSLECVNSGTTSSNSSETYDEYCYG